MTSETQRAAEEAAQLPLNASAAFQRDSVYMLYTSFCCDVEKTAFAAGLPVEEVRARAKEERWDEKLRGIIELKKSRKPGAVEKAVNRGINENQAHRLRLVLEAMIQRLTSMTPEELQRYTTHRTFDRTGNIVSETLSTRPLADLAAALEKCHSLTYMALADTASDRKAQPAEAEDDLSAGEIHARLAEAFAKDKPSSQS